MNINDFTQYPQAGKTYAKGEVPSFVIHTQNVIGVKLRVNSELVFSGQYNPDFDGVVTVDFAGLYDSCVETFLPDNGKTEISQSHFREQCMAEFRVISGEDTTDDTPIFIWYVANVNLNPAGGFDAWSRTAFLTGQPDEKPTCYDTPEWLTWFDLDGGSSLKVRFYRKATGNPFNDVLVSPSLPAGRCRSVAVGYSRLIRLALMVNPSNLMPYYDLILFNAKGDELTRQRYVYTDRTGKEQYYCFVNSLGGIDTLICRGEHTLQPDVTHNVGRFSVTGREEYSSIDDTDDTQQWRQETGMVPYRWRDWVSELLAAKCGAVVYDMYGKVYREIVLKSSELEMGNNGQLASASFIYIMSEAGYIPTTAGQKSAGDMHQSAAESGSEPLDETIERSLPFESGVTEAVSIPSERLLVNLDSFEAGTEVTYLIDGEIAGSLTVGSDANKTVLAIPYGASVSFMVEGAAGAIEMSYYDGWRANEFYRASWTDPVCVQVKERYTFAWNGLVCVQVEAPYTFGWSEAVCVLIPEAPKYTFVWSEAVCVQQYSYVFTWEDF